MRFAELGADGLADLIVAKLKGTVPPNAVIRRHSNREWLGLVIALVVILAGLSALLWHGRARKPPVTAAVTSPPAGEKRDLAALFNLTFDLVALDFGRSTDVDSPTCLHGAIRTLRVSSRVFI